MKDHIANVLALVSMFAASIANWQEQIEWGIRIGAGVVAIAAGVAAFLYHRAKTREIRERAKQSEQ